MKAAAMAAHNHHRRHHSLSGLTILHLRRDFSSIFSPPAFFSPGRSPTSDQVNPDLDSFQKQGTDEFHDISSNDLLSIAWIQKLLEAFLRCHGTFQRIILRNNKRPPTVDRMLSDLNDRMVKALDVLNAVRDGTDRARDSVKLVEIRESMDSMDVRHKVGELRKVFGVVREGLGPLERKVREVFHQIVKSRNEEYEMLLSPYILR